MKMKIVVLVILVLLGVAQTKRRIPHSDDVPESGRTTYIESSEGNSFTKYCDSQPKMKWEEWDYIEFVQGWSGTFCERDDFCHADSKVVFGFTVHGLWPSYSSDRVDDRGKRHAWPECCQSAIDGDAFDEEINKNVTLLGEADYYWPELGKKNFRGHHEWERHGTCANSVYSPTEYVTLAINLAKKYDLLSVLEAAGIKPSATDTYSVGDIKDAIHDAYHAAPKITCKPLPRELQGNFDRNAPKLIDEVYLCFDHPTDENKDDPVLIDCPQDSSCKAQAAVLLLSPEGKITIDANGGSDDSDENIST